MNSDRPDNNTAQDLKAGARLRNTQGDEMYIIGPVRGRPALEWYVAVPNPPFGPRQFIATTEELRAGGYTPVGGRAAAADDDTVRSLGVTIEAAGVEASE